MLQKCTKLLLQNYTACYIDAYGCLGIKPYNHSLCHTKNRLAAGFCTNKLDPICTPSIAQAAIVSKALLQRS